MKRILIALVIVGASVAMASPAGAKDTTGTATVADGATMAEANAAATTAAQAACTKAKRAKAARVTVSAGAVVATFNVQCAAATAAPTTPPTTKAPPGPLFQQAGDGTATTASFKVPSNWDLQWTYDCSQSFGGTGNFIVTIYDDYGQDSQVDFDNQGINQLGAGGSGVEHYHSGGNTKFLKIVSLCPWTVTAAKP